MILYGSDGRAWKNVDVGVGVVLVLVLVLTLTTILAMHQDKDSKMLGIFGKGRKDRSRSSKQRLLDLQMPLLQASRGGW